MLDSRLFAENPISNYQQSAMRFAYNLLKALHFGKYNLIIVYCRVCSVFQSSFPVISIYLYHSPLNRRPCNVLYSKDRRKHVL